MSRFVRKKIYGRGLGGIFRGIYKFFRPLLNFILPTISKVVSSKTGKKLIKQAKKICYKSWNSYHWGYFFRRKSKGFNVKKIEKSIRGHSDKT